ncbi:hypothetical protein BCR35DRAFT_305927 [Leucosporidium creatinivorum]|uniref:Uncharacterized protein n=1 Tax=Leucosporidium creatinivorum TaxID=106004 RepID=A0A1Y2EXH3_9BASI|nr:hypothetical protein BCR35DRAFT_305927 [Leucosporidium creatinivorum]
MSSPVFTPTHEEPWTIPALLDEARRLQKELPPLFSWEQLREIIGTGRLDLLERHPSLESLYSNHFNLLIRSTYGGVETYLRAQLGWQWDPSAVHPDHWSRDDEVQVRKNDWAYSVPRDVEHYVVWVPSPLFHPLLCTPPPSKPPSPPHTPTTSRPLFPSTPAPVAVKGSWEHVSQYGLSGVTGFEGEVQEGGGEEKPEREIEAFVKRRWSEGEWETMWFANPPSLQSVRGLAHFHVLVRRKGERTEA